MSSVIEVCNGIRLSSEVPVYREEKGLEALEEQGRQGGNGVQGREEESERDEDREGFWEGGKGGKEGVRDEGRIVRASKG